MTILVTTPNGKVGTEVVKQLLAQGQAVRVGAHTVEKAKKAFPGAEVVPFDFADEASVKAALKGVKGLYLASPTDTSIEQKYRVIDLAKAAGVQRIVNLSAMGVENTDTPLRLTEKYIEASGLEFTILRPTWFMQNYSTGSAESIKHGVLAEPAGDGKTGFIDTRDIAAVAVAALTQEGHNGKFYALTGGEVLNRYQAAELISQATGQPVQYVPQSDEDFRQAMQNFMAPDYLDLLVSLYGGVRTGWTEVVTPDVQQVLGRAPITFAQFAQDYKEAWLQSEAVK